MADVFAIFGVLLALGIMCPGLLTSWWLLFPNTVGRAQTRLDRTPGRCFGLGVMIAPVLLVPIIILTALPSGLTKLMGWSLLLIVLAGAALGAAGLVAKMGNRLARSADSRLSPAGAFVRSAIALELAAAFPIIGWFIVIPLTIITAVGATAFALLNWMPREITLADGAAAVARDQAGPLSLAQS